MNNTFHNLTEEQLFKTLKTNIKGLSSGEVAKRELEYGENVLPRGKEATLLEIFIR